MIIQELNPVHNAIVNIYEKAKGSELSVVFFESVKEEISMFQSYFRLNEKESFLLALFVASQLENEEIDLTKLANHIGCSKLKLLSFNTILNDFIQKGLIEKNKGNRKKFLASKIALNYSINDKIIDSLLSDLPMPLITKPKPQDIFELLELVYKLGIDRFDEKIETSEAFIMLNDYLSECTHFPLIKKINELKLTISDTYIFINFIRNGLSGIKFLDIHRVLAGLYSEDARQFSILQEFIDETHTLVTLRLLKVVPADNRTDTECHLTDLALKLLHETGLSIKLYGSETNETILPASIQEKTLILHEEEMKQILTLQNLLEEDRITQLQERLENKALAKGIAILLHGSPGTGKTEIARQLAKKTNRELIHVNISECKTKWFGESERLTKKIFTDYKSCARNAKYKPILFFNEADAIIAKRKVYDTDQVDQTENTIQNILLEEIENFDGILIATTNLIKNIDMAFERRFLFKIELKKPGLQNRASIWRLKLPFLNEEQSNHLAELFDFSGGQIDNIIRKKEISELLNVETISFQQIITFCREETILKSIPKIGFRTS